jgi:hypothetical protein
MKLATTILLATLTATTLAAAAPDVLTASGEYRFPDDAGVLDVKHDFGAKGDGVADDTATLKTAIQTALRGNYRNPRTIFLPAGTYAISEPLKARVHDGPEDGATWCNGWRCGLFLVGESRARTVLRLRDGAPGFGDPAKPQAVVITGSTGHDQGHEKREKRVGGIEGTGSPFMSLRDITSRNVVPVFRVEGGSAVVSILDSAFNYNPLAGGLSAVPAQAGGPASTPPSPRPDPGPCFAKATQDKPGAAT